MYSIKFIITYIGYDKFCHLYSLVKSETKFHGHKIL